MPDWSAAREEVRAMAVELADRGFLAGTGGNLALRVADGCMAVTPSATDYYRMRADEVCILRLADLVVVAGDRPPSVESGMHARVLRARPDCAASIHTHQPVASAYSLLARPFAVPARWQDVLGREVPVAGYAPSGTGWLARNVGRCFQPQVEAVLLQNHGVVGVGRDLAAAAQVVATLEAALRDWFTQRLQQPPSTGHAHTLVAALRPEFPFS